jgi:MFS family permease
MFAGFCVSFATSSASAFLIIYGIKIGMPKDQASLLLSVLLFGTIFSVPIGYLTDILNRRLMMIFCSFIALVFAILLSENKDPQKIYYLLFFMFGALAGMKLPAILLINEKYKSTQRLAVNSAFSRFSLTGNICGLFATGFLMKIFGSQGLWISLIAILTSFLFFCAFNYAKKIAKKEFKPQDFSIFYKKPDEPNS